MADGGNRSSVDQGFGQAGGCCLFVLALLIGPWILLAAVGCVAQGCIGNTISAHPIALVIIGLLIAGCLYVTRRRKEA